MKNYATVIAVILSISAPSLAATSTSQLQRGVENKLGQLGSRIELPALSANDLAILKGILESPDSSNHEKINKTKFYLSKVQ